MIRKFAFVFIGLVIGAGFWRIENSVIPSIAWVFFAAVTTAIVWLVLKTGFQSARYSQRDTDIQSVVLGALAGWALSNLSGGTA
ncbi:MAG: hypothetical protein AAF891_03835 [Pseudomonadota bacterium]